MAALYQSPVDAIQVGSYFVGQYYQVIQQQPDRAFQFYTDASTVMRVDGLANETATSTLQIDSLLTSLKFAGIEITNAHSLNSWDRGVIVMVSGLVQMVNYSGRRNFVQTFFLAPQESGYYVLNDIMYLLDEETVPEVPRTALAHSSYECDTTTLTHLNYEGNNNVANHHLPEPVSGYMVGDDIQTRDYLDPVNVLKDDFQSAEYLDHFHTDENDIVNNYSIPEPPQPVSEIDDVVDESPVDEPIISYPPEVTPVRDLPPPAEEPIGERPKQTYASILRAKGQPGNSISRAAPASRPPVVASDAQLATPQLPYTSVSTRPEKSTPVTMEHITQLDDEGEVKSVYVGNLSSSVSADDLEHEFKNFGRIRPDGVAVRSRKDSGGYYAFVEFEDAASVENALKASPILVNGQQIYVEERRPNSGISRLGGRRGRGRGGYQSDVSRGRFGGRGFSNDREMNGSRPRGNGILSRVPRQERGILGNHA